ncbi:MAG: AfsR/SARP family transcriptional regulator, partial [Actinobacteria bacterium]|nr:AfsR/SARP family transcriptional regulator [Actinomycetota bacterium]
MLALLLIDANRVVSRDHLIDELWGERPPPTAVQTVQVYISRLRKILGEERIETRANGYVLRVAPEELDVGRFEQLLASARGASEPARRAELARQALAVFAGEPFADFAAEAFAQAEISRLAELRLEALEERIAADLELGHAADVVAELEVLARAEPQRERVQELLMLSLYRAGRQADALEVYRDVRRTFSEELGIEPGQRLRALERAILAQDPSLEPERGRLTLPRQRLPAAPNPLIGRKPEMLA